MQELWRNKLSFLLFQGFHDPSLDSALMFEDILLAGLRGLFHPTVVVCRIRDSEMT